MDINEQKGKAYDVFQKIKLTLEEDVQEQLNDLKGVVPEEWEDTYQYIEAMQRHIDNMKGAVEFGVSTVEHKS
jgi:gas vesicle protein